MKYYNRAISNKIIESLAVMPAIFLNGPRQVGKSTLMHWIIQEKIISADYVTFDDITIFASASSDPEGFLRGFNKPIIIDEVQKVPQIFSSLKLLIDEYRQKDKLSSNGRFILTGSVSIMAVPKLSEALVGRMTIISLYPLSASEVIQEKRAGTPVINGWFDQKILFEKANEKFILDNVIHKTSFPEVVDMDKRARDTWFNSYISTLLQRDVRELAEITKIAFLPNMLKMLAARVGSTLNNANFAKDALLDVMTYERYRILLEKVFLITLVKPWYRNINLRLVRTPKVYFTDTALLCHQLGVDPTELKQNKPILYGHILENFVFSELQKQMNLLGDNYTLYYFRVHGNKEEEVDFVIERKNGSLIGIEVKSKYSVTDKDFTSLNKLKKAVGKDFIKGIVLYHGEDTVPFSENMVAMPISKLWSFNMEIIINQEMYYLKEEGCISFWANYGYGTKVRCDIEEDTISDFFWNNPSEHQMKEVIEQHWHMFTDISIRKIREGQISIKVYEAKTDVINSKDQEISRVLLTPRDFDYKDFRK
jgi:uncharacterized protein